MLSRIRSPEYRSVVFILPSLAHGGAEQNTVHLANYFASIGLRVEVWALLTDRALEERFCNAVVVRVLNLGRLLAGFFPLLRLINQNRSSAIIANLWPLTPIVALCVSVLGLRFSTIFVEHINLSSGLRSHARYEFFLARIFHRASNLLKLRFVAVSEGVKLDLIHNLGVQSRNIEVIANPVLPVQELKQDSCVQSDFRQQSIVFDSVLSLLAVGNLKPQKNYRLLIDAISILKSEGLSVRLLIAGDGPEREGILSYIKSRELTDQIILLGRVDDPVPFYRKSEIFVLSSAWEGFGNVLIEALYWGCKVVSTDCPSGPREILKDGAFGELVPNGDAKAFANAIKAIRVRTFDRSEVLRYVNCFRTDFIGELYRRHLFPN